MLDIRNLEVAYGESMVLRDISLQVKPGEVVCLMGRNGVGKTTLVKSMMGILKPRSGSMVYNGLDMTRISADKRAKAGIGYVPQGREIFAQLSVHENLLLGLEAAREKRACVPQEVLDRFPVLTEMMSRRGGDLSGGQQQQLAFARALASSPALLILDEPTEGIQPSIVDSIRDVIQSLKASGNLAILLVEQSLDFVREVADSFYVIQKGTVVAHGGREDLTDKLVRDYLVV
ncbi:urea ABC transporter ATP-binding subunit UrtE [Xylanibacillus composti]|uniref:ABC transporter ATP-binding protein n=1 Tax=Xylanibacillus composti TaxID=1572762 RepID=A0A8J4M1G1_9BACL|nr:urea ABC transporter ATP-binding subunit UrtE [Xylanibacillus composti]MDT9723425.1 urea ABC transporter ATP-binding subunit UrtE [Xylanibacillus composti]GIQ68539.1 ABC transporter ATP-binding protein [Xylanibacillus composti]